MAIAMSLDPTTALWPAIRRGRFSFGVRGVAKPEWGSKRVCLNCGARFYDLGRDPIVCPACQTVFDPTANSKPRRARAAPKAVPVAAAVKEVAVVEDDVEIEVEDEEVVVADEADEEGEEDSESAIEDVSELGDDDMSDVIDADLDEDDTAR
jgi:uncharacterized protein (TIGR02300 family)